MHLIVPFAGPLSDAGRQALHALPLPRLEALLAGLSPSQRDDGDEFSRSPPHERVLARSQGWSGGDGGLPWAAQAARLAGLEPGDLAWARLTPVHLHLGTEQVTLTDPAALRLDEDSSRALFERIHPLFASEGFVLHWAGPLQWLAAHEAFAELPTASLDRVVGRNIDAWLSDRREAPLLRRLLAEVQMLLYTEPLNAEREAAGLLPVNSLWLSGCGRAQPTAQAADLRVDDRLRGPALAEDWAAWREAWAALDAERLAPLARHDGPLALTLCGERCAQTFERLPRGLWQRVAGVWRRPSAADLLEGL